MNILKEFVEQNKTKDRISMIKAAESEIRKVEKGDAEMWRISKLQIFLGVIGAVGKSSRPLDDVFKPLIEQLVKNKELRKSVFKEFDENNSIN